MGFMQLPKFSTSWEQQNQNKRRKSRKSAAKKRKTLRKSYENAVIVGKKRELFFARLTENTIYQYNSVECHFLE